MQQNNAKNSGLQSSTLLKKVYVKGQNMSKLSKQVHQFDKYTKSEHN